MVVYDLKVTYQSWQHSIPFRRFSRLGSYIYVLVVTVDNPFADQGFGFEDQPNGLR